MGGDAEHAAAPTGRRTQFALTRNSATSKTLRVRHTRIPRGSRAGDSKQRGREQHPTCRWRSCKSVSTTHQTFGSNGRGPAYPEVPACAQEARCSPSASWPASLVVPRPEPFSFVRAQYRMEGCQ